MRNWMNLILTESVEDKSEDNTEETVEECDGAEVTEEVTEEAESDCDGEEDCDKEEIEESTEYSFLKYLEEAEMARPFGKRAPSIDSAKSPMQQAIDMVAKHVSWTGLGGSGHAIKDAAVKFGLNPEDIRAAITPDMVRQWHRNL